MISLVLIVGSIAFVLVGWFWKGSKVQQVEESPCFIATAAFGSPLSRELQALRDFRDRILIRRPVGRLIVRMYYTASPPVARMVARSEELRQLVRSLVTFFVGVLRDF